MNKDLLLWLSTYNRVLANSIFHIKEPEGDTWANINNPPPLDTLLQNYYEKLLKKRH